MEIDPSSVPTANNLLTLSSVITLDGPHANAVTDESNIGNVLQQFQFPSFVVHILTFA
jgi:hypothetical protein